MTDITAEELAKVNSFPRLVDLLRDKLDWPIPEDYGLEDVVFEYEPRELGLKDEDAAKLREIHQLRPLVTNQPWGIFFLSFEDKTMSVTVLRRILRALVVSKRGESKDAERAAWDKRDLIFAANFGKSGERELAFVHFNDGAATADLPVMKVLGWNAKDTKLHNEYAAKMLGGRLAWPVDTSDDSAWRTQWSSAFEIGYRQVIKTSRDLALHLAGLATQIRARANELLEAEADDGPMRTMLGAFRKNLIHDLDEDGFADMFAQTICYGMLAAAISRESGALVADNMADMVPRTNPFLKELFANFLKLGGRDKRSNLDFDELGVREVVDMLQSADMPAVLRDFGDRNPKEDPVIHFYELFLKEYDPAKRMQRGVFYTPRPVVNFIVRGVDEILRTEFDLPLGLADTTTWRELAARNANITIPEHIDPDQPFVQILDPATGTGTFLVEVIDLIHKRMLEHWQGEGMSKAEFAEAWNEYVPANLLPRLTAFELMMAPYSIAHMKVGLKLSETGYEFGSDERARIFLTNALEPANDLDMQFDFMSQALAHEAKAANEAKDEVPFTAIIGNPPYSNFGQLNKIPEIDKLLAEYKKDLGEKKINLNDDFIKFVRYAHNNIVSTSLGILGFITNNVYLDGITHRRMRESLLEDFSTLHIVDLHGSSRKQEVSPDGDLDENVFGIAQGVGIGFFVRDGASSSSTSFGELWGGAQNKLDALLGSDIGSISSDQLNPAAPSFWFVPKDEGPAEYASYEALQGGVFIDSNAGVQTKRDNLVYSFSEDELEKLGQQFMSLGVESARKQFNLPEDGRDWTVKAAQRDLRSKNRITIRVLRRPFDLRWTYYTGNTKGFMAYPRAPLMLSALSPNVILLTVRNPRRGNLDSFFVSENVVDKDGVSPFDNATVFPLWRYDVQQPASRPLEDGRPNITGQFLNLFSTCINLAFNDGIPRGEQQSMGADYRHQKAEQIGLLDQPWDGRGDLAKDFGPRDLFDWIYAILHAPSYRSRYAEFLKSDFPRIPIPKDRATFAALVPLGRRLVALHLLKPEEETVLKNPEIRFAGTGEARVEKGYPKYRNGKVEINANRWFEDVPKETWGFHVGGYQVCDKWLKDRAGKGGENPRAGRVLTEEDILHYRRVVSALTETRTIMAEIDKVIEKHGGWPGAFAVGSEAGEGA